MKPAADIRKTNHAKLGQILPQTWGERWTVTSYLSISSVAIFMLAISVATTVSYWRIPDWGPANPANIISGSSQAPNQYRLLTPLLYGFATKLTGKSDLADRFVTFTSILFCYIACAAFFQKSTGSLGITMLCLLALLGSFQTGFMYRHRQEFWETGLLVLYVMMVHRENPNWKGSLLITFLGSLNRETWIFTIIATIVCHSVNSGRAKDFFKNKANVMAIIANLGVYTAIYVLLRCYYYV